MTTESKILITNPAANPSAEQDFTSTRARTEINDGVEKIRWSFPEMKNSDGNFIKVIELAAGNGPYADRLIEKEGLPRENITCIDRFKPAKDRSLQRASEANWIYLDLVALSLAIKNGEMLLTKIEVLKHNFDAVIMTYPFNIQHNGHINRLTDFFAKEENSIKYLITI